MKGFFYRLLGAVRDDDPDDENTFEVSLGELRKAMGDEPDPTTDHLSIRVEYEADDEPPKRRRRWI